MDVYTKAKLDYLADTKADIKAALIEKGHAVSDADPFRSYGDKVRAIETGGGGGSLPAGVYGQQDSMVLPAKKKQVWFEFNGELYAAVNEDQSSSPYYRLSIYKYTNGTWTQIVAPASVGHGNLSGTSSEVVVYHGKVYIFAYTNYYAVWDGANSVAYNSADFSGNIGAAWVYNDTLYVRCDGAQKIYTLDESSGTWVESADFTTSKERDYYPVFVVGDGLYHSEDKKMYQVVNNALVQVSAVSDYINISRVCLHDGFLYYADSNYTNGSKLYKYDFATHTETLLGQAPPSVSSVRLHWYNGLRLVGSDGTMRYNLRLNIIEASE